MDKIRTKGWLISWLIIFMAIFSLQAACTGCTGDDDDDDDDKNSVTTPPTITYTLTTQVSPAGAGSIIPANGDYSQGQTITIAAHPIAGWQFSHWLNTNDNNQNPTTVTMDSDKTVTAVFTLIPVQYNLTTAVSPVGAGTINPASGTYNEGQIVNLTATPTAGYQFDHWQNTNDNWQNPTTVTIDTDKTVTAVFTLIPVQYNLTTAISPVGAGTINPASGVYNSGQIVNLTATANAGWQFAYWQNTDNEYQNPTTITMNGNKTVAAFFIPQVIIPLNGLNYSPFTTAQPPGPITDSENLAKLESIIGKTSVIRTFSSSLGMENTADLAAQMGIEVVAGVFLSSDLAKNEVEINNAIALGQSGKVSMIIVGNEILLFNTLSAAQLINYIRRVKQAVPGVTVSYSDTWDTLINHPEVVAECDVIMANIYSFWQEVPIEYAVYKTREAYLELVDAFAPKQIIIAEAGWPSDGQDFGDAVSSPANAAFFLQNFVSWALAENISYFYFEAFNEPWKVPGEGTHAEFWGIMDGDGVLKPGMQDIFDGQTVADNWSGTVVINGAGTPDIYFTYVPPMGSFDWVEGQINHVAPADYKVALFVRTYWGWYNKPTWDEPLTNIYPDGWWTNEYATGAGDENAYEIRAFLVPIGYTPPLLSGQPIPQEVYDNAIDWVTIVR